MRQKTTTNASPAPIQTTANRSKEIDWDDVPEAEDTNSGYLSSTMTAFWGQTRIGEVLRDANRRHVDPRKMFADCHYTEKHETLQFRTVEKHQPPRTGIGRILRKLSAF